MEFTDLNRWLDGPDVRLVSYLNAQFQENCVREQGDIFVVPPWHWHHHENKIDQDAILFSINDWPVAKALGIYREEQAES